MLIFSDFRKLFRYTSTPAKQADILFADEPTSHLDMNGIVEVEKLLSHYPGTVVLVSHDRELLDEVCTRILELENCKLTLYKGNYTQYRAYKETERDQAWLAFDNYVLAQLLEAIQGKKKRANRATKTSSRIDNSEAREGKAYYAGKAAKIEKNVKVIERILEKLEAVEKPQPLPSIHFDIQAYVPIHGKAALRLTNLTRIVPRSPPLKSPTDLKTSSLLKCSLASRVRTVDWY